MGVEAIVRAKGLKLLAIIGLLYLTGCREVLYSNLTEDDANELTAVLLQHNIDASKVNNGKSGYSVEVDKENFVLATSIARDNSLPKREFESLGTIFSGQGMISSQTEERSRLSFALSQELSKTLLQINGVLNARVHIVLAEHDQMSGRDLLPSASVFIRHTKDSPVKHMIIGVKETVAKAVPGLDVNNVTVMTEEFIPNVFQASKPKQNNYLWLFLGIGGSLLLLLGATLFVLYKKGYRVAFTNINQVASQDKPKKD